MRLGQKKTRFISLFVLAFLCFNAGGILCLTYCSRVAAMAASGQHCPLAKEHCGRHMPEAQTSSASVGTAGCCSMPVSFFAAPVEKRVYSDSSAAVVPAPARVGYEYAVTFVTRSAHPPIYTPPCIDRHDTQLKNCVFRI